MSQASDPETTADFRSDPGHLTLKVEGLRAPDLVFSFERQPQRMGGALFSSVAAHGAFLVFVILMGIYGPRPYVPTPTEQPRLERDIVWLNVPGPGGGGGGGGNQMQEPPKKAELPGQDRLTVPAVKPPAPTPTPPKPELEKPVEQAVTIPAKTLGDAERAVPGALEGLSAEASLSLGPGTGGGAGTGQGTGIGEGQGSGLGPGYGGGTGGGAYRPGAGIDLPRVIREVRPNYTADAMRAKVQGTVWVEAVVLPDGTVGEAHVTRSLDSVFGLDNEALKAARQWRFTPGTRFGQPVPVLVTIELTFTLR